MTTPEDAAIIRSAAREIATEFGIIDVDALQLADFSDVTVVDGRPVNLVEAMVEFRRKKPAYFGLGSKSATEMTTEERIRQLEQIRDRDRQRQAKRLAAPALAPGETRKSAKDMDPKEYASTLAAIKRRGN